MKGDKSEGGRVEKKAGEVKGDRGEGVRVEKRKQKEK